MSDIIKLSSVASTNIGSLSFFQTDQIGFDIKRIYYIYGVPEKARRGFHAHKKLQQLAWCPYGDITLILDDGKNKNRIRLNDPSIGLIIKKGIWREMIWNKKDSVLCVAASDYFKEDDYIRNYDNFLKYIKEGYWDGE